MPRAGPQDFLTQALRLRAGLASLPEIAAWAEGVIAAAPEPQLPQLTDLIFACSGDTASVHDTDVLLQRLGVGGSSRASLSSIAAEFLSRVQNTTMRAEDAFNAIWHLASARPELLMPLELERLNTLSLEIVSWPQSVNPWAEIVGDLIPSFLKTLSEGSGGAA